MDIEDLRKFLVVARLNNLQLSAVELNQTAGALSKVIKRLEDKFNKELFTRSGRNIVLNQHGEKLRNYAQSIVHEADQVLSEFSGDVNKTQVNIAGPSLLLHHWLPTFVDLLPVNQFEQHFRVDWEGAALNALLAGHADLALLTESAVLEAGKLSDIEHVLLGATTYRVVASENHEMFLRYKSGEVTNKQLREYAFVCPDVSPIGGNKRGIGSDGWRDDKVPRTIGYKCNDFSLLLALVQQGKALAYVPEIVAQQYKLKIVNVLDCDYSCEDRIFLSYRPSLAFGWLNKFIHQVRSRMQRIDVQK